MSPGGALKICACHRVTFYLLKLSVAPDPLFKLCRNHLPSLDTHRVDSDWQGLVEKRQGSGVTANVFEVSSLGSDKTRAKLRLCCWSSMSLGVLNVGQVYSLGFIINKLYLSK